MAPPFWFAKLSVRLGVARWLPSVRRLLDGGGMYLRHYSDRVLAAPHTALMDAAACMEVHGPDTIDLGMGSPRSDLVPSSSTKLPADRRGWPPPAGIPELRAAVAERLLADHSVAVNPVDEVLITPGAAGAFAVAADAFLNPGDRVVLFDPTSPLFAWTSQARQVHVRWLPSWVENGRLRFAIDRLARALRRARMIVVHSPSSPTGGIIAIEDLEQIAWWAKYHDVLMYSDEVFSRYCYSGECASIGSLPEARKRTLTVGSLSKGHALAAARVGWLAGCRHLVRPCLLSSALHTPFVSTVCQQIAVTALRQGDEAFGPILAEFEARRRYAFERLRALELSPEWPEGAFFLWLPVWQLGLGGREFSEQLLKAKRVLVTPGEYFGPSGKGYVRISFAIDDGRLREGLNRLAELVNQIRGEEAAPLKRAA